MKMIQLIMAGSIAATGLVACNNDDARYLNLNTGENVELRTDSTTGLMVDSKTGKPVEIYVDTKSRDTIYGSTGKVVNGHVIKTASGSWEVKNDGDEYKAESGDAKIKSEGEE